MAFKINRQLLPMKFHYLLYHAGLAPVIPFVATYARQLGFSSVTVGLLFGTLGVIAFVLKPLYGYLGDRFHLRKALILTLSVLIISASMVSNFIPPIPVTVSFDLDCSITGNSILQYCPNVEGVLSECIREQVLVQLSDDHRMQCSLNCSFPEMLMLDINMDNIVDDHKCLNFAVENITSACPATFGTFPCVGTCSDPNVMYILGANRMGITERSDSSTPQFWLFAACMVLVFGGMAGVGSITNAMCFALLGDKTHRYGQHRMLGSLGWGSFALIGGLVVDAMSGNYVLKNYSGVFYMMFVILAMDWFVMLFVKNVHSRPNATMLTDIGRIFYNPRVIVFFVWCITVGIGTSLVVNFLFWHLEELSEENVTTCEATPSYIKTLQGLVMAVQTFGGEVPMLFLSGRVFKLIGYTHSMTLVLGAFALRFLLYSVLTNVWWVLPIETLQGVTFGIFVSAMNTYANMMAPIGAEATLQGISSAIYDGIGKSIGGMIGGYALQRFGGRMMFRWFGVGSLVLCGSHFGIHVVLNRWCPIAELPAAIAEVTEDILHADLAEQRNETNEKHKYTDSKLEM